MNKKAIVQLLIYARGNTLSDNEKVPNRTHLQKEMFLLQKETSFSEYELYDFVPYYYGPFSRNLDSDVVELAGSGNIDDSDGFLLTHKGFAEADKMWKSLRDAERRALIRIKEKYNNLSSDDLLKYVYSRYRKYTMKSALPPDNLFAYFDSFSDSNDITVDYLDSALNRIRHPADESGH